MAHLPSRGEPSVGGLASSTHCTTHCVMEASCSQQVKILQV